MNIDKIKYYIDQYKLNFKTVHRQEIYKWQAVKCFQENWDINAIDFTAMIDKSLLQTKNLLDSGNYFPKRMIINNSKINPELIKPLFIDLFDEQKDLIERIRQFQTDFSKINSKNFAGRLDYQDPRAIIVYLVLRYPERYFLYKFTMFKNFAEKIDYDYIPVKGRFENIGQYQKLCVHIKHELIKDQEILKLHKDRLTNDCFYDENLNILTQDFIYAVDRYLDVDEQIPRTRFRIIGEGRILSPENSSHGINFKGRIVNYEQIEKENKRIGDLGEKWVIQRERNKLINAGLQNKIDKIKHISVEEGDGTGFDIKSFDEKGNEIFIEVKTTTGNFNQAFYISRNELERSKSDGAKYYLYRVYEFNEKDNTASLKILQGNLENLCDFPTQFKVKINEK
ncbi:protein of unknown function [Tangfeifania diversioriginum]|uniref:Protein NO VEIN C-terminal domain-containing protein n=1 Tax=Tangfeifania diversioriginum TaxID=1168035 RepID=A0A1M6C8J3_9BACT|nr:DUF3883 domain-containing protein [Tangfeifania diversioriginum]SHI57335.1 protein of unknown function [Tangfeifania diversioriginum]